MNDRAILVHLLVIVAVGWWAACTAPFLTSWLEKSLLALPLAYALARLPLGSWKMEVFTLTSYLLGGSIGAMVHLNLNSAMTLVAVLTLLISLYTLDFLLKNRS